MGLKIGILSDTHGLLRLEVAQALQGCDAIFHAGDIDRQSVVARLEEIAPLYAVRGNADKEWAEELPLFLTVQLGGKKFYLVHNKKNITAEAADADYIVYGHSHKYEEKQAGGQVWLNPGCCGKRKASEPVTMMLVEVEDGRVAVKRVDIPNRGTAMKPSETADMAVVVKKVVKEMERGTGVEDIAAKCRIEVALAEQICRMYATHPGIDVDGILNRIVK